MSLEARDFYQQQASAAEIPAVPDILNGECMPLLDKGASLGARDTTSTVFSTFLDQLEKARTFVVQAADPEQTPSYSENARTTLSLFARRVIMKDLWPQQVSTGRFNRIFVEAISPYELPEQLLRRTKLTDYLAELHRGEPVRALACLAVTGTISSGSVVYRPAALAVIRANPPSWNSKNSAIITSNTALPLKGQTMPPTLRSPFRDPSTERPKRPVGLSYGGMRAVPGGTKRPLPRS